MLLEWHRSKLLEIVVIRQRPLLGQADGLEAYGGLKRSGGDVRLLFPCIGIDCVMICELVVTCT